MYNINRLFTEQRWFPERNVKKMGKNSAGANEKKRRKCSVDDAWRSMSRYSTCRAGQFSLKISNRFDLAMFQLENWIRS